MTLNLQQLLERLGFTDTESHQLCMKAPGGVFTATVRTGPTLISDDIDVWYGPNPVHPVTKGRSDADNITRLAALWADIDVDPNKCPDHPTAWTIVEDLSAMLGTQPIAITYSGHGIQPIWAVEDGAIGYWPRSEARALLRRWGRLVVVVAGRRGTKVDSVWDLPRILRCPGSINHKDPHKPKPVICAPANGSPLSIEHILEVLKEQDIPDHDSDHRDPGTIISAPDQWTYVHGSCIYAQKMVGAWATDTPTARHPWLLSQATRVAAAHRNGCLSHELHQRALNALTTRFQQLLANGFITRDPGPGEIQDAIAWGQAKAAAMTERDIALELGAHTHWAEPTTTKGITYAPLRAVPTPTAHVGTTHPRTAKPDTDPLLDGATVDTRAHPEPAAPTPEGQVNDSATVRNLHVRTLTPPCGVAETVEPVLPDTNPQTATPAAGQPLVDHALNAEIAKQRAQRDARAYLQAERAPSAEDLNCHYLDTAELDTMPAAEWLIEGMLAKHTYSILRGRDGTYKSFLALGWGLSLATGDQWQGRPTQQCKVLYIAGEGAYGIAPRVKAWRAAWQPKIKPGQFTLRTSAVNLHAGGPILDDLIQRVADNNYGLIIVDTLRRSSGSADENSSDMGVVVDNIDRIKRAATEGSILVIAHTAKSDIDSRGYSGIEDDADMVWHIKREESENDPDHAY